MDSKIYRFAVERIEILKSEVQRLETFIATFRELADRNAGNSQSVTKTDVSIPSLRETAVQALEEDDRLRATPQAEIERVVIEIITEENSPMRRNDLLDRVKERGIVVGGRNERTNLGTKLSRATSLVYLPRLGYWPRELPYEPGSYHPGQSGLAAAA